MSDNERPHERELRVAEEGGLDEATETWRDLPENLARNKRAELTGRTTLLVDGALSTFTLDVLTLEQGWWKFPAAKDTHILTTFDITPTRYYQLLNAIIDMPEAYAHDPMTVRRLRAIREKRREARTAPTDTESEL